MIKSACRRTAERLTPYVDEALPAAERAEVEQHLEKCPPCRAALTQEKGGRRILRECAGRLAARSLPARLRARCEAIARKSGKRKADGSTE